MRWIPPQAMPLVQALWRHRWFAVGTAWLVCTAGWIGTASMPTKFESSARVYLNTDPRMTPLLHGLAADTNPSRHLDFMLSTSLSRSNSGGEDNGTRLEQARGIVTQLKLELADAISKRNAIQKELAAVPTTLTLD